MKPVKIAFVSRVDYGSPGFRLGFLNLAAQIFREERVDFVVWVGGIVYHRALDQTRREGLKKITGPQLQKRKEEFKECFQNEAIQFLTRHIPRIRSSDPNREFVKQYLVTSPAYDSDFGHDIVAEVARKRSGDLVHWGHGCSTLSTQESGRDLAIITPQKATWLRGKYDSTPVERVILDWANQHNGPQPYLLIVGCFGNHIVKPGGGQWKIPVISIPSLCSLQETRTGSENQAGVVILELTEKNGIVTRLYPFNYLLTHETHVIRPPRRANENQRRVVEIMKQEGPQTIGLFAHHLGLGRNRAELRADLETLRVDVPSLKNRSGHLWPGIVLDDTSGKYSFDPKWIQEKLPYALPKGRRQQISMVAFGCMHAGCVHTNYDYITRHMPTIIQERDADVVLGAGDFVEGLRHNLDRRGEVMPGMNNDDQQTLAGQLTGDVLLDVLRTRLTCHRLTSRRRPSKTRLSLKTVESIISEFLPTFVYIPGNHCCWVRDDGFHPLRVFRFELVNHLVKGIQDLLSKHSFQHNDCQSIIRRLVSQKIVEIPQFTDRYRLPIGFDTALRHPWLSNTITASIRSQQLLNQTGAPIAISANYHTALFMARFDGDQRLSLQVGTLKDRSAFEHEKLKNLDTGIGALKITVADGIIISAEVCFDVALEIPPRSTRVSGQILCDELGVKTYPID